MEEKRFYIVELANEYGITAAVLLTNIIFWIQKNMRNGNNCKEGRYWTYNSITDYTEQFPEFNERQISYSLRKLESNKVLITGNFNKRKYDKTKWYSLGTELQRYYFNFEPDYYKEKPIDKFVKWIIQFCQMEYTILSNGCSNIVKPIPYINHINKSDIISDTIQGSNQKFDFEYYQNKWNDFASIHNLDKVSRLTDKRKAGI